MSNRKDLNRAANKLIGVVPLIKEKSDEVKGETALAVLKQNNITRVEDMLRVAFTALDQQVEKFDQTMEGCPDLILKTRATISFKSGVLRQKVALSVEAIKPLLEQTILDWKTGKKTNI